ncbi:hypothetical protein [Diaphorobacter caeni]|uniref:hypothetical protein n=1 Tax=Diaphorobacter caeni TaxID=2784387 RepID=UPI00189093A4|nr:hypothetical protein [Diaphorobacter caeni]MBF5006847.1 hypothetical protein [Diaphorobacter caeni]
MDSLSGVGYISTMPKPLDRYRPPMSLAESERLLRGEAEHREMKEEWAGMGMVLLGIFAVVLFFGGLGFAIHSFFG